VLSGTGRLVQAGSGVLVLGASNTFAGQVLITNTATLRLTNAAGLGAASGVTIQGTGNSPALELSGGLVAAGVPLAMYSVSAGGLRATLTGGTGSNRWSGPVTVAGDGLCQLSPNSGQTLTLVGNVAENGPFTGTLFVRGFGNGPSGRARSTSRAGR
jgi:autotransporter-associated beta strand protein